MRERNRDRERLEHIQECLERIARYTADVTMEQLAADDMRYYAVVKNIEIIGEAANMLTTDFRDAHPETPWKMISGMRNYIVHEYFQIDNDVVRDVLRNDLPQLGKQIAKYLAETDWESWSKQ